MNARKIGLGLLDLIFKVMLVVIAVMLISKYSKVAYNYGYRIFNQVAVSSGTGRTVTVTITDSDTASSIADKLANVGLITDKTLFRLQEMVSDYHGMEVAGIYELSTAMTPEEMLQIMASGESIDAANVSESSESIESEEPETSEATEEVSSG